jgi:serine/threonine-protein kinase
VSSSPNIAKKLLGWSGTFGVSDARAFLQKRVALHVKVVVSFLAAFWIVTRIGQLSVSYELFAAEIVTRMSLVHLGLTLGLALGWLYLDRGARKFAVLHAYESLGTLAVAGVMGFQLSLLPEDVAPASAIPAIVLVLVTRASVVPSSAARTFLVGAGSTLVLSVAAHFVTEPAEDPTAFMGRYFQVGMIFIWGVAFSGVTAVISRVIYGLTERVRAALELGQYRLVEKVGEGGMGAVYRGEHALLKRPTAIKLLAAEKAGDLAVQRFEREVVHTSRLNNPHTVAIYDFGRTQDGVFYYAMEYLDGIDLQDLVEVDGRQSPARVVKILRSMAESLGEAHAMGLVHRDVKPANVILSNRGGLWDVTKVVDFGLVKEISGADSIKRSAGHWLAGTPLYLSPEAITDPASMDGRADIYSLGAVGYFLLTGEHVFASTSLVEICSNHIHDKPIPPSVRMGEPLPEALEALILRCLEKKPEHRFDAIELMHALEALTVPSWTDEAARAWWTGAHDAIGAHLAGKRAPQPKDPVTVALSLARRESQAA